MMRLDKTLILSTAYKEWEKLLEKNSKKHPKYTNTKIRKEIYLDIVMNLFYLQKGLCAYTEQLLCDEKFYKKENWEKGKYKCPKPEFEGQLEHFDESLKSKNKDKEGIKDWLWSNFFMIHSDINTKVKGRKSIEKDANGDYIIKPDMPDYNEFELLEYDINKNIFRANRNLLKEKRDKIDIMIKVLGLNYGTLSKKRKETISRHQNYIKFNKYSWKTIPFGEFSTAIKMYKLTR